MGPVNETLIRVGCLGAGLLIGGQVTYILARNKFLQTLDRIVTKETAKSKEYYRNYYQKLYEAGATDYPEPPAFKEEPELPPMVIGPKPERGTIEVVEFFDETDLNDLDLMTEYPAMQEVLTHEGYLADTNTPDEEDVPVNPTGDPKKPYRLTFEQFDNAEVGYEKNSVTYYPEDGVVVDENDEPSPMANEVIGQENLDFLTSDQADWTIYVRNDHFQQDFEVNLAEGSYSVAV